MKSDKSSKSIENLENQKVESDKITGGGRQIAEDMGWRAEKNRFTGKAQKEQSHNPASEKGVGKRSSK